mmetsp:Transcript_4335/g.11356  ORF Transcript_4335/g.11356 Transcript_4335/m.11356 type:complete len:280 (-) Transcript_4335:720-1559(-)
MPRAFRHQPPTLLVIALVPLVPGRGCQVWPGGRHQLNMPARRVEVHGVRVGARHPQLPLRSHHAGERRGVQAARAASSALSQRHAAGVSPEASQHPSEPAWMERPLSASEDHARYAILLGLRRVPSTTICRLGQLLHPSRRHLRLLHVEEARVDHRAHRQVCEVRPSGRNDLGGWVQPLKKRAKLLYGTRALLYQVCFAEKDYVRELDLVEHQLRDAAVIQLLAMLVIVVLVLLRVALLAAVAFAAIRARLAQDASVAYHIGTVLLCQRLQAVEHVVDV